MFLGDLVKLKPNLVRNNKKDKDFIENAYKEDWIWLITGIDDEDLDYIIRPIYYYPEDGNMTQLGAELLVLHDEIEVVKNTRKELFKKLNLIRCNFG